MITPTSHGMGDPDCVVGRRCCGILDVDRIAGSEWLLLAVRPKSL